jgi:hypothetical protein
MPHRIGRYFTNQSLEALSRAIQPGKVPGYRWQSMLQVLQMPGPDQCFTGPSLLQNITGVPAPLPVLRDNSTRALHKLSPYQCV